jgi:GNAT superfamily N-acetyltransferase
VEIRLVQPGEEAACNDFHNRLHHDHRLISHWRWEYVENGFDRPPIPFALAKDGDRIVGTQAFIPIRMIDRDGIFWTAKSEATLVDPDYRGQQLFEKMYDQLFQYAEEKQLAYIWGFTPAIKAFTRLQFETPGETAQIYLPFSSRSIATMTKKISGADSGGMQSGLKRFAIRGGASVASALSALRLSLVSRSLPPGTSIRTMETPDPQAGECCNRFIQQFGGTTIYRDAAYMQWRLFNNPFVRSIVKGIYDGETLLGWVAYTLGDDGMGYLVDIIVASDSTRHQSGRLVRLLLREAIIGTRNMGATGIRGWQVNRHPFDQLLLRESRKVGFYHVKRGHFAVIRSSSAGKGRTGNQNFNDWYISRIFTEGVLS